MPVSCRICDAETVEQPWGGSVCMACGSISVTNLPSSDELERYYLEFNQGYHGGGRLKGARSRQVRYGYAYLKPLLALQSGVRLLDIGSSTNPFPNIALAHGYDVTVLDYIPPCDLDTRARFVKGVIEDDSILKELGENSFDVVTAFQVIEHCRSPRRMLEHMVRLCSDKGYVILATPLANSFSERNALGKSAWFYPPEHIHLLSVKGMTRILGTLNCKLVSVRRYELNWLRWLLRYGLAYLEGCGGLLMKRFSPKKWAQARNQRTSKVQELVYYVFKKA